MADWTLGEVDLIIADYMSMLTNELAGIPYSKTDHRKNLVPLLNHRSEGAIEFKHCNISAVLIEMGLPFIKGYKRRSNTQQLLVERCENYLGIHQATIETAVKHFVEEPVVSYQRIAPALMLIEAPPQRKEPVEDQKRKKS